MWRKERTCSHKLSSDLHTCAIAHMYVCTHMINICNVIFFLKRDYCIPSLDVVWILTNIQLVWPSSQWRQSVSITAYTLFCNSLRLAPSWSNPWNQTPALCHYWLVFLPVTEIQWVFTVLQLHCFQHCLDCSKHVAFPLHFRISFCIVENRLGDSWYLNNVKLSSHEQGDSRPSFFFLINVYWSIIFCNIFAKFQS